MDLNPRLPIGMIYKAISIHIKNMDLNTRLATQDLQGYIY